MSLLESCKSSDLVILFSAMARVETISLVLRLLKLTLFLSDFVGLVFFGIGINSFSFMIDNAWGNITGLWFDKKDRGRRTRAFVCGSVRNLLQRYGAKEANSIAIVNRTRLDGQKANFPSNTKESLETERPWFGSGASRKQASVVQGVLSRICLGFGSTLFFSSWVWMGDWARKEIE